MHSLSNKRYDISFLVPTHKDCRRGMVIRGGFESNDINAMEHSFSNEHRNIFYLRTVHSCVKYVIKAGPWSFFVAFALMIASL
jgi:hypothetical protein